MDRSSKIFVQIASYRDPECQYTIKDLFEKAAYPDRIRVAVCFQYLPEQDAHCFEVETRPEQVCLMKVHIADAKGVCWARRETQKMWQGEEYTLQIDAHMRFVPEWDRILIEELEKCDSPKPILSCYPPAYLPPNMFAKNPRVTVKRFNNFTDKGELRCHGLELDIMPDRPVRGAYIAAGFMFARGQLIQEVPYDPYMYFMEEEPTYSARLHTHGWEVFSPSKIVVYHYYIKGGEKVRPLHWTDKVNWRVFSDNAYMRGKHLLGVEETKNPEALRDIDQYGFGNVHTLEDFCAFIGVNFKTQEVTERAWKCGFSDNIEQYLTRPIRKPEMLQSSPKQTEATTKP